MSVINKKSWRLPPVFEGQCVVGVDCDPLDRHVAVRATGYKRQFVGPVLVFDDEVLEGSISLVGIRCVVCRGVSYPLEGVSIGH